MNERVKMNVRQSFAKEKKAYGDRQNKKRKFEVGPSQERFDAEEVGEPAEVEPAEGEPAQGEPAVNVPTLSSAAASTEARERRNKLVTRMDMYINNNLSTSSTQSQQISNSQAYVGTLSIEKMLKKRHINEVPKLTGSSWAKFVEKVNGQVDPQSTNERAHIHPIVQSIINACLESVPNTCLRCEYETALDEDSVVKRPNATMFPIKESSQAITAVTLPLEYKLFDDLIRAGNQSMGYNIGRIRGQLEMVDAEVAHLCGFCVGCDGEKIIVGFAEVKNMELKILFTGEAGILLWPKKGDDM